MHAGNSTDPYVTVICPTCHARLNPRRELLGKRVRCPDCGVGVRVEEGPAASAPAPLPRVGEYSLSESDRPVEQPKTFLLKCPTCGTRMFPRVDLVGKRVRCPDCRTPVRVPPPPIEREAKQLRSPGEYNVGAQIEPIVIPEPTLLKHLAKIEKEDPPPAPPPPDQWWWRGVLDFPWRGNAGGRWAALTIFATITSGLTFAMASAISALSSADAVMQFGTMALIVFSGLAWFFTLAYTSGCVVAIIRSAASGSDTVDDWSDLEVRDSIWNSVVLWLPLLSAAAVSYGGFALTRLFASQWAWWGGLATFYLVFPVFFFSVMERGSALALISPDAVRMIWGHLRGWLLLMIEIGLLLAPVVLLTRFGLRYSNILTALFGGPMYAALVMILARLMGRYFYRAHETIEARRLKKEQAEADADEDEEEAAEESFDEFADDLDFGA